MSVIWEPPELATVGDAGELEDWRYVVVDELIETAATLVASVWPTVDPDTGRRQFGDADDDVEIGVDVDRFQRILDQRRLVGDPTLQERPVRIGDVFAISGAELSVLAEAADEDDGSGGRPDLVVPEITIVDVTASAREAAKVAFRRAIVASEIDQQRTVARQRENVASGLERLAIDAPPDVGEAVARTVRWLRGED